MSVSNPETFTITGGSVADNSTAIINALAAFNVTGTFSGSAGSAKIVITNAGLAPSTESSGKVLEKILRICDAEGAKLQYVAAT